MWQRIQTLYIGISTALISAMFFCNFAEIIGPSNEEIFIRYYEKTPFLILMIMILAAQICALFSYKSWFLQARVCMIVSLLLIGFQIWLGIDFLSYRNDMVFNISGVFPVACAILDIMAAKASMVDHMTMTAIGSARKAKRARKRQ